MRRRSKHKRELTQAQKERAEQERAKHGRELHTRESYAHERGLSVRQTAKHEITLRKD